MQRLEILQNKLKFIRWFFEQTTTPFAETKRKIESREYPYDFNDLSEDASESPFTMVWMDAEDAINLQGQLCLSLLQRSLMEYLEDTVKLNRSAPPSKGKNWFENYRKWFFAKGVDWNSSTACLTLIEEMTMARNRVQHGSPDDSHNLIKKLDQNYHARFPDAVFKNSLHACIFNGFGPKLHPIELTKEKLERTIEEISKFSTFIEKQRIR